MNKTNKTVTINEKSPLIKIEKYKIKLKKNKYLKPKSKSKKSKRINY